MPTARVNGVDLYYREHGSGPLNVIMGHGLLVSSSMWKDDYFPRFPESWHVYALDLRAHGGSSGVQSGFTFRQMADDISAFARVMGFDRYVYIGISMSGGVGVQLALNHTEDLQGLVLISPVTGLAPVGGPLVSIFGPLIAQKRPLVKKAMEASFMRERDPAVVNAMIDEGMLVTRAALKEFLGPKNTIDGTERLSTMPFPSMVMIAGKDTVLPVDLQHELAARLPHCRKVFLPEMGHGSIAEEPDLYAGHIVNFINGLAAASAGDAPVAG